MEKGRLTALALTRPMVAGMHPDGGGLYLQVGRGGARSWIYRYTLGGRQRYLGLGSANDAISLKEARELARQARALCAKKIDPIEHKRAEHIAGRLEAAKGVTFAECAQRYIAAQESGWRNAKHAAQWSSTLRAYVAPVIGRLPVQEINTSLILQVLKPLWGVKTETASRVRGRVEAIIDWATAHEYRSGDNPARWRGHLDKLLPGKTQVRPVKHFAALPYALIGTFMEELRSRTSISARCLEYLILTAARTSEAINARWDEINFETRIWTIPARRMKSARDHRVPLSPRAVEILHDLYSRREHEYVFAGTNTGRPISNMTLSKLLGLMDHSSVTVHGFRSCFRDWCSEQTDHQNHVVELALAHAIPSAVEAAYRRGDMFEKRRRLMDEWAAYCMRDNTGKVAPLRSVS